MIRYKEIKVITSVTVNLNNDQLKQFSDDITSFLLHSK